MAEIRTRFAPSPTGPLHIGGARSALFNYLFAKKQGGAFILRIEDTDLERSDPKYEKDIFESFRWLGISADESPEAGGPLGPYRQSERIASYRPYLEQLVASGQAYHCPHSEEELAAERNFLMGSGKTPVHACEYRDAVAPSSGDTIIRFKTPPGRTLAFPDLIRGDISFQSDLLGDFSIAKVVPLDHPPAPRADGRATQTAEPFGFSPLYNFAVTIDDREMEISHVIRGEDHISNTPKQMLIAEALGFPPPAYAHLPLILGPDRSKLSKRHGATAVSEFRSQGYLPDALVNFMALLGWNPGGEREIFNLAELIERFDLAKIQKGGAVFNRDRLDWMNGEYIRSKSPAELALLAAPFLGGTDADQTMRERIVALEQPRLKNLSELRERTDYFFREPEYPAELLSWKNMPNDELAASLGRSRELVTQNPEADFSAGKLQERFLGAIGAGNKGELLWPLRVALTGKRASPGPFEIMEILGKDRTLRRIDSACAKVSP